MKTIVSVSGGLASAEVLRRVIEQRGRKNTVAVFADVKGTGASHFFSAAPAVDALLHERYGGESHDTYRFLWELSHALDIPIVRLEGVETIWTTFAQKRAMRLFVGTGFYCPASEQLKRLRIANWLQANFPPGSFDMALGMNWDEQHRLDRAATAWPALLGYPVRVWSPLMDKPYADDCSISLTMRNLGVTLPAAYENGFDHNNCGGGCVHAGQGHFAQLYNTKRDVYLYWAYMERQIQRYLGKGVTILKDERGGFTRPLSLFDFIPRIEVGDYQRLDLGGCGCFTNSAIATFLAQAEIG